MRAIDPRAGDMGHPTTALAMNLGTCGRGGARAVGVS